MFRCTCQAEVGRSWQTSRHLRKQSTRCWLAGSRAIDRQHGRGTLLHARQRGQRRLKAAINAAARGPLQWRIIGQDLHAAKLAFEDSGQPARVFKDFVYRTHKTWSRARGVVGKAEHLAKGANPRSVVTSLAAEQQSAQPLYEQRYCGRGEMENRIKEQQLYLMMLDERLLAANVGRSFIHVTKSATSGQPATRRDNYGAAICDQNSLATQLPMDLERCES